MSSLFETDTDGPIELAPPDVVTTLEVDFGYRRDVVKRWSKEKAETVLASCRRRHRADLNHAAARAAAQAEEGAGEPALTARERVGRLEAAACLEQAVATNDGNELLISLTHAMYPLTRDELRGFAVLAAQQLRADAAPPEAAK